MLVTLAKIQYANNFSQNAANFIENADNYIQYVGNLLDQKNNNYVRLVIQAFLSLSSLFLYAS